MRGIWDIISICLAVSALPNAASESIAGLARSEHCTGQATNALEIMECALPKSSTSSNQADNAQERPSPLPAVVTATVITTVPPTRLMEKPSDSLTLSALHEEVKQGDGSNSNADSLATSSCDGTWLTSAGLDGQGEHFSLWCERKSAKSIVFIAEELIAGPSNNPPNHARHDHAAAYDAAASTSTGHYCCTYVYHESSLPELHEQTMHSPDLQPHGWQSGPARNLLLLQGRMARSFILHHHPGTERCVWYYDYERAGLRGPEVA